MHVLLFIICMYDSVILCMRIIFTHYYVLVAL